MDNGLSTHKDETGLTLFLFSSMRYLEVSVALIITLTLHRSDRHSGIVVSPINFAMLCSVLCFVCCYLILRAEESHLCECMPFKLLWVQLSPILKESLVWFELDVWFEVGCCDCGDCVDIETSHLCFWDWTCNVHCGFHLYLVYGTLSRLTVLYSRYRVNRGTNMFVVFKYVILLLFRFHCDWNERSAFPTGRVRSPSCCPLHNNICVCLGTWSCLWWIMLMIDLLGSGEETTSNPSTLIDENSGRDHDHMCYLSSNCSRLGGEPKCCCIAVYSTTPALFAHLHVVEVTFVLLQTRIGDRFLCSTSLKPPWKANN